MICAPSLNLLLFRSPPSTEDCVDFTPHLGASPWAIRGFHEDFVVSGMAMADRRDNGQPDAVLFQAAAGCRAADASTAAGTSN
jgi:hypothetical protein